MARIEDIKAALASAHHDIGHAFAHVAQERPIACFAKENLGCEEFISNVREMRKALEYISDVELPPINIHVSSLGGGIIIHEKEPESLWLQLLRDCVNKAKDALSTTPESEASNV